MSLWSWIGLTKSDEEKQAESAYANQIATGQQAAIALANDRQTQRDQYHNLLTAETAPYQAYSNRLAAGWGAGMSTAGLSANDNPVTLRDTGLGAPVGSNYVGWSTSPNGGMEATPATPDAGTIEHLGIQDQLNGTGHALGTFANNNDGTFQHTKLGVGAGNYTVVGPSEEALAAAYAGGPAGAGNAPQNAPGNLTTNPSLTQQPGYGLTYAPRGNK